MNIKYLGQWKDNFDNTHSIQILTDDTVESIENINMIKCEFEYPDNHILSDSVLNGQGGEISFISPTRLYFSNLYTENYFKYRVKHLINNEVYFNGYLNSEEYNDSFSNLKNYEISFKCNDGISLLERLKYSNTAINKVDSAFSVIKECLDKLHLDFYYINISLSTTIPNITISDTLLHNLHVNTANYFNEKGESLSCREVINAILLPISAKLYIHNNSVYIVDVNGLKQPAFKRYKYSDSTYFDTLNVDNHQILNELYNGDESLERESGVNQVNLKFSKYCYDNPTPFNFDIANLSDQVTTYTNSYTDKDGSVYYLNTFQNCDKYTVNQSSKVKFIQETDDEDNSDYYIRLTPTLSAPAGMGVIIMSGDSVFEINTGIFVHSSPLALKIEFSYMIEDLSKFKKQTENVVVGLYGQGLGINLTAGNYQYMYYQWYDTTSATYYQFVMDNSEYEYGQYLTTNKWYKGYMYMPLNHDYTLTNNDVITGDFLKIKIAAHMASPACDNYYFAIKDIKVSAAAPKTAWNVNHPRCIFHPTTMNDSEITGYLNPDFKNDLDIEIIHGSDPARFSRGAYLLKVAGSYADSSYATNERIVAANTFTRAGQTATIEKLLLNTYLSNYEVSRYVMQATIRGFYRPFDYFNYGLLKRDDVVVDLIPMSISTNYVTGFSSIKFLEFVGDKLTIQNV